MLNRDSAAQQFFFDAKTLPLLPDTVGVRFSPCGRYRYELWRVWNADGRTVTFIALAPDGADDTKDDAAVRAWQRLALQAGYGGFYVVCLFACCEGSPQVTDRSGPDNDAAILRAARKAALVVRAWGDAAMAEGRDAAVLSILCEAGITTHALDHIAACTAGGVANAGAYAVSHVPP